MAPTLKDVSTTDAADPSTAAARGDLAESGPGGPPAPETESAPPPPPSPPASSAAAARRGGGGDSGAARVAPPPPVSLPSCCDPSASAVPSDPSDFVAPPHFSRSDPFHRALSDLDRSLRCPICQELYSTPVTLLPCLHTFCSLCVRSHLRATYTGMKRRADCPTCHEAVRMPGGGSTDYERGILPNPQLEQQVDHYSRCREPLRSSLVRLDVLDGGGGDDGNVLPPSSEGRDASGAVDDSAEPAPGGSAGDPPPRPRPKRRPTHRYHGLSRKKLAALCRADGLDAKGDEATLRRRHADFVTRYNAECDATRPRSAAAVARDVQGRERAIQSEAAKPGTKKQSQCMQNLGRSVEAFNGGSIGRLTSGNEKFDVTVNDTFAKMIAEVKRRKQGQQRLPPKTGGESAHAAAEETSAGAEEGGEAGSVGGVDGGAAPSAACSQQISGSIDDTAPSRQVGSTTVSRRDDGAAAASPSALSDSNETGKTPQKRRQDDNLPPCESAPKRHKAGSMASAAIRRAPSARNSRVSSLGPWVCSTCTYENTTRKFKCGMCETTRPKPPPKEAEVVHIDC